MVPPTHHVMMLTATNLILAPTPPQPTPHVRDDHHGVDDMCTTTSSVVDPAAEKMHNIYIFIHTLLNEINVMKTMSARGLLEKFTAKLSDQDYDLLQGHKGRNEAGLELRTGMDVAT